MIGKVTRGRRVAGLLAYLFGPGRANEHDDPHVVAGFRHPAALEPPMAHDERRDVRRLAALLNSPLDAQPRKGFVQPVWHCGMRTAPGDRVLSDDEWAEIAEELMHRTGLAPRDDDGACRWVAVRHAPDHVHLVVTLAREDSRWVSIHGDHYKVRAACRAIEQRFGLTVTAPADRTAAPRPTRAETEHAGRTGRREPPRTTLRRLVSQTVAGTSSVEGFLTDLDTNRRVTVRVRYSSRDPGSVTGYAVALHGHTDRDGNPIWFSGGKLAPDLTIPQLRRRYTPPLGNTQRATPAPTGHATHSQDTGEWYKELNMAVAAARRVYLNTRNAQVRADLNRATADTLHLAARVFDDPGLGQAADLFDRVARQPYLRTPTPTRYGYALRQAARIHALDAARHRHPDPAIALLHLLAALIDLVQTIADLLHAHQATAARHAADRLTALRATPVQSHRVTPARSRPDTAAALAAGDFPAVPLPPRYSTPPRRPRRPTPHARPQPPSPDTGHGRNTN
ncbi:relaxase/mobilization nuclease domain-containing protein [Actinomadura sp. 9N215]|uniref:relaxase/mobilization nuclease domain-containing protein n=1 Tax=Actinomadura sp. 9N215 TaxID=3375150 RepID=UPI003790BE8A